MSKARLRSSTTAPRVISYVRFSTPEQRLGDSERRQLELAKAWADEKGYTLDDPLKDDGRSGYHGDHRKKGELGDFLQKVEANEVPVGSILVVENIDRISREDFVQAFETITGIVKRGITIVTLRPYAEYTRASITGGMIYQLVGQMQMAHEESKKKIRTH